MRNKLPSTNWLLSHSILSADMTKLGAELAALEAGGADWVHVDVMDGHFVANLTMGPIIVVLHWTLFQKLTEVGQPFLWPETQSSGILKESNEELKP